MSGRDLPARPRVESPSGVAGSGSLVVRPSYDRVAGRLRDAILAGLMPPGAALPPERELSKRFEVGRTTIREALRALQAQGLIVEGAGSTRPSHVVTAEALAAGAVCDGLSVLLHLDEIDRRDLAELVLAVECAALDIAVHRNTLHLEASRAALETMRLAGEDLGAFVAADTRFHLATTEPACNTGLTLIARAVRHAMAPALLADLRGAPDATGLRARALQDHEAMLAAVEAGDARGARRLLREHLEGELSDRAVRQATRSPGLATAHR